MLRDKGVVSKKAAPLEICRMGRLGGRVAAETDMLSPVCQRGAEVGFSILAAGRKNAIRYFLIHIGPPLLMSHVLQV